MIKYLVCIFYFLVGSIVASSFEDIFYIEKTISLDNNNVLIGGINPIVYDGFKVNKDGLIFLADIYAKKILVFNQDGKYNRITFAKGHGPGELISPNCLSLTDNLIIIADSELRKISIFDVNNMEFKQSFFITLSHTQPMKILGNGDKLIMSMLKEDFTKPGTGDLIAIYKINGEFDKFFYPIKDNAKGLVISYYIKSNFIVRDKKLFAIQNGTFGIDVFSLDGKFERTFGKKPDYFVSPSSDVPSIDILSDKSMQQRTKIFKKYVDSYTPLSFIFDTKRFLFIGTQLKKENSYKYEIYNFAGKFITGDITVPFRFLTKGQDGFFYFLSKNEFDDENNFSIEILKCKVRGEYE